MKESVEAEPQYYWYLGSGDERCGGFTLEQLVVLWQDGTLSDSTYVWTEGMSEWKTISAIAYLHQALVDGAPPSANEADQEDNNRVVELGDEASEFKAEYQQRLEKKRKRQRAKLNRLARQAKENNAAVYVTGLPTDTSENEVFEVFRKCGIIKPDSETGEPKIKLYRDETTGMLKGDGLVIYALRPSLENALQILDGSEFRPGSKLLMHVREAEFSDQLSDWRAPKRSKPANVSSAEFVARALSWNDGLDDGRGLKIVILKHVFDTSDPLVKSDPDFYETLKADIQEECEKIGPVDKVTVFARNSEGPVGVKFVNAADAEQCIEVMHGRWVCPSSSSRMDENRPRVAIRIL